MRDVISDSFKAAFSKKLMWAAIIVIPVITTLFGFLYVYTFLDPYNMMKNLPVAIVNLDQGVKAADAADGTKNYGADLENTLLDNASVLWTKEGQPLLDAGLENSKYYMAVIIPKDFSAKIAAGETSDPQQADIVFFKNVRKNYMLATLSAKVENEIYKTVNQNVSEQYTKALVNGLYDVKSGFQDATDGASQLKDGADELSGALDEAGSGAQTLLDGTHTLAGGINDVSNGAASIKSGTSELLSKASALPGSQAKIVSGLEAVQAGVQTADSAAQSLHAASSGLDTGLQGLSGTAAQLTGLSTSLTTGLESAAAGSDTVTQLTGDAADNINQAIAALTASGVTDPQILGLLQTASYESSQASGASAQVSANIGQSGQLYAAAAGVGQYAAGISAGLGNATDTAANQTLLGLCNTIDAGLVSLDQGLTQSSDALGQIHDGASTIEQSSKNLVSAVKSLDSGAAKLNDGAGALTSGIDQAYAGQRSLANGISDAAGGAESLSSGAGDLEQGLSDGLATIDNNLKTDADTFSQYVAEPVVMQDDVFGDLSMFGFGFAPLFMTMCFWLGTLLIFFVVSPFPTARIQGKNRFEMYFGRWPIYLMLLLLEVALVIIWSYIVGIPRTNGLVFALQVLTIAFSFMCIMLFLNLFGVLGKALSILILIFQLVGASGTFPVILGKHFANMIAPFLPYTYAIDGYREVMSGGNMATAFHDMGMLLVFAAATVAFSLLAYPAVHKKPIGGVA